MTIDALLATTIFLKGKESSFLDYISSSHYRQNHQGFKITNIRHFLEAYCKKAHNIEYDDIVAESEQKSFFKIFKKQGLYDKSLGHHKHYRNNFGSRLKNFASLFQKTIDEVINRAPLEPQIINRVRRDKNFILQFFIDYFKQNYKQIIFGIAWRALLIPIYPIILAPVIFLDRASAFFIEINDAFKSLPEQARLFFNKQSFTTKALSSKFLQEYSQACIEQSLQFAQPKIQKELRNNITPIYTELDKTINEFIETKRKAEEELSTYREQSKDKAPTILTCEIDQAESNPHLAGEATPFTPENSFSETTIHRDKLASSRAQHKKVHFAAMS